MALYKYFKPAAAQVTGKDECPLPDPEGPLSTKVPCSSIQAANEEVRPVLLESAGTGRSQKRGHYKHYTADEKARIAKRAAECGVTSTVRYFSADFSDSLLLHLGKFKFGGIRQFKKVLNDTSSFFIQTIIN